MKDAGLSLVDDVKLFPKVRARLPTELIFMSKAGRQRLTVVLIAVAALVSCRQTPDGASASRPNILVILVDDARWDDFGFCGSSLRADAGDRSPRPRGHAVPECVCDDAALLAEPRRDSHGPVRHTNGSLTTRRATLPVIGCRRSPSPSPAPDTAPILGKWHMGNDDTRRPGWSRWVAMKGQGEAIDPQLNVDGERIVAKGYVTDILTDHVVDFIRQSQGAPFMAFLAHKALHPNVVQRDDGSVVALPDQRRDSCPPSGIAAAMRRRRSRGGQTPRSRPRGSGARTDDPRSAPLSPATGTAEADVRDRLEMYCSPSTDNVLRVLVEDPLREARAAPPNTAIILISTEPITATSYGEPRDL
jgi:N-acetylglucosamine-6-sulfatase